jgi:hypothetical protein
MADAQDLKSWDLKQSCGFKSHHRHHFLWETFSRSTLFRDASGRVPDLSLIRQRVWDLVECVPTDGARGL